MISAFPFRGVRFIESVYMTIPKKVLHKRKYRIRHGARHWRMPKMKTSITRTVIQVPNPDLIQVGDTFYGHPATLAKVREQVNGV